MKHAGNVLFLFLVDVLKTNQMLPFQQRVPFALSCLVLSSPCFASPSVSSVHGSAIARLSSTFPGPLFPPIPRRLQGRERPEKATPPGLVPARSQSIAPMPMPAPPASFPIVVSFNTNGRPEHGEGTFFRAPWNRRKFSIANLFVNLSVPTLSLSGYKMRGGWDTKCGGWGYKMRGVFFRYGTRLSGFENGLRILLLWEYKNPFCIPKE
jgi:hypothetical protein